MSYKVAILTVSDRGSAGLREDLSGPAIHDFLKSSKVDFQLISQKIVPDEEEKIIQMLRLWSDDYISLILTTGGTGFSPRDITPEATLAVIERQAPGFAEAMRSESRKITPHAMISRAVSGIRKQSLIINLPGSIKGVQECLAVILPALPHALDKLMGDQSDCGR